MSGLYDIMGMLGDLRDMGKDLNDLIGDDDDDEETETEFIV